MTAPDRTAPGERRNEVAQHMAAEAERLQALHDRNVTPWLADLVWAADKLRAGVAEIERLTAERTAPKAVSEMLLRAILMQPPGNVSVSDALLRQVAAEIARLTADRDRWRALAEKGSGA